MKIPYGEINRKTIIQTIVSLFNSLESYVRKYLANLG